MVTEISYIRTVLLSNKSRQGLYHYFKVNGTYRYYKATNIPQDELHAFLIRKETGLTNTTVRSFVTKYGQVHSKQPLKKTVRPLVSQPKARTRLSPLKKGVYIQNYTVQQLLTQPHVIFQQLLNLPNQSKASITQYMKQVQKHTIFKVVLSGQLLEFKEGKLSPTTYTQLGQLLYTSLTPQQFKSQFGIRLLSIAQQKPSGYLRDIVQSIIRNNNFKAFYPNQVQVHDVSIQLEVRVP